MATIVDVLAAGAGWRPSSVGAVLEPLQVTFLRLVFDCRKGEWSNLWGRRGLDHGASDWGKGRRGLTFGPRGGLLVGIDALSAASADARSSIGSSRGFSWQRPR